MRGLDFEEDLYRSQIGILYGLCQNPSLQGMSAQARGKVGLPRDDQQSVAAGQKHLVSQALEAGENNSSV